MPRTTEPTSTGPAAAKPASKARRRVASGGKHTGKSAPKSASKSAAKAGPPLVADGAGGELAALIAKWLDEAKAESIVAIDIRGKTSIGDCMFVASGRSDRHVGAIADQLQRHLRERGVTGVRVEGLQTCDWVLVDVGAIVVNVFRPDVRTYYNLEKMWLAERPADASEDAEH